MPQRITGSDAAREQATNRADRSHAASPRQCDSARAPPQLDAPVGAMGSQCTVGRDSSGAADDRSASKRRASRPLHDRATGEPRWVRSPSCISPNTS